MDITNPENSTRRSEEEMSNLLTCLLLSLATLVEITSCERPRSLADRLLALWTDGRSISSSHPKDADDETKQPPSLRLNGIGDATTDDSFKKVLEFLNAKAATGNKKMPDDALAGLRALASGSASTPRPITIELTTLSGRPDAPMAAALAYFHGLGIDDDECRKRTICELLTEPQAGYGIFGELLGYVFGSETLNPEWKSESMEANTYRDYHEAAVAGRQMLECDQLYQVCRTSYREYIKLANV